MKFVTYKYKGAEHVGALTTDESAVIPASELGLKAESMLELIDELAGKLPAVLPHSPPQVWGDAGVQGISCAVQHIDQIWHGDKASFCRYYTTEIPFLPNPCFLKTTAFVSFLVKFAVFSRICRNFFEKISGLQPF